MTLWPEYNKSLQCSSPDNNSNFPHMSTWRVSVLNWLSVESLSVDLSHWNQPEVKDKKITIRSWLPSSCCCCCCSKRLHRTTTDWLATFAQENLNSAKMIEFRTNLCLCITKLQRYLILVKWYKEHKAKSNFIGKKNETNCRPYYFCSKTNHTLLTNSLLKCLSSFFKDCRCLFALRIAFGWQHPLDHSKVTLVHFAIHRICSTGPI